MPVSLARRIGRIGLVRTYYSDGKRMQIFDESMTTEQRLRIVHQLRVAAKSRRIVAKAKRKAQRP